jgi:hypothetical protein
VNGLPGGRRFSEPVSRHRPEPTQHARLFVVGDYLFDSTLNGVLDSADLVVELIADELEDEPIAAGGYSVSSATSTSVPVPV